MGPVPMHGGGQLLPPGLPPPCQAGPGTASTETPPVASAAVNGIWEWGTGGPCLGNLLHLKGAHCGTNQG